MNEVQKRVIVSVVGCQLDSGYFVKVLMKDGRMFFLSELADNIDEMSFDRFKMILSDMKLDDIYSLKLNVKNANLVKEMIEDELRRRHKPLSKNASKTGKNSLKDTAKKAVKLDKNQIVKRATEVKEK